MENNLTCRNCQLKEQRREIFLIFRSNQRNQFKVSGILHDINGHHNIILVKEAYASTMH